MKLARNYLLFLPLQLLVVGSVRSESTSQYRWFCDLSMSTVVTLEWSDIRQAYIAPSSSNVEENGSGVLNFTNYPYGTPPGDNDLTRQRRRHLWQSAEETFDFEDDDFDNDEQQSANFLRGNQNVNDFMSYSHQQAAISTFSKERRLSGSTVTTTTTTSEAASSSTPIVIIGGKQLGLDGSSRPPATVEARACDCWNSMVWGGDFYCPLPRTHCAIPNSPTGMPGCVDIQKERRVVRSVWPVLVVWYASVLFCLSFTITGRHALSCCIAAVLPSWNRRATDRILRNNPNLANQMMVRHFRLMRRGWEQRQRQRQRGRERERQHHSQSGENAGPDPISDHDPFPSLLEVAIIPRTLRTGEEPAPTALQLKTRIYKHHEAQKDGEEQGNSPDSTGTDQGEGQIKLDDKKEEVQGETSAIDNDDTHNGTHPLSITLDTLDDDSGDDDTGKVHGDGESPMSAAESDDSCLEWDDRACTICYSPLEDGDRVGALKCGHIFHVDPCLKHWLTRRNVCPLCLTEDIATPQFDPLSHQQNIRPVVVGPPPEDDSNSDVDRSSSRDDSSRTEGRQHSQVPAFQYRSRQRRRRTNTTSRRETGIELPSFFFRSRRNRNSERGATNENDSSNDNDNDNSTANENENENNNSSSQETATAERGQSSSLEA